MSQFPIDQSQIFAATNGGLDILTRYLDIRDLRKNFKIRKEGNPSANIFKSDDGTYMVYDHGDTGGFFSKARHAIHVYAHFEGRTYFESLLDLGRELGLVADKAAVKYITKEKFSDFKGELNEDGFTYKTKDFTPYELEILGPLVTPEVCRKYGLYSLESYSWRKKEEGVQPELCDVYTVKSTETYPVFAFIMSEGGNVLPKLTVEVEGVKVSDPEEKRMWLKIYQPKNTDKKYRFSYLGKKPRNHIFGFENLKGIYNKLQAADAENLDEDGIPLRVQKLERVVICSGDRDSLNMASTGETVVWFNSETADVSDYIFMLYKYAKEIVNVPDLDPTGFEAGKKVALEHLDVKTAWLPEALTKKKDFRGNPMKDFTDFMKVNAKFDDKEQKELREKVKRFIELARPGKFWSEKQRRNKEGLPVGDVTYTVNYKNAFNFLKLNGFFRIKNENRKDGYYFVKQDGHVLTEVSAQEIKDFFNQFLDRKQQEKGLRWFPDELLNMLIGSEAVSDKKLVNLPVKDFDFTDYTPNSQFLFFDKFIWEVTKDDVKEISSGYSRYVMNNDILNNIIRKQSHFELDSSKIKVEEPFFKITKDQEGNWDLTIKRKDCDFMNYLINGSRVFWKEEVKELGKTQREEYLQENKFILDNYRTENGKTGLNDDQVYEQEVHFINKVYSYGYMLHRYKDPSKAWVFYVMDNEVVDDNESHGRTGKSLFSNLALRVFMNSKYMGARKKGLLESDFLYDGVTEQTDYILFDDADKRFPFQQLFTDVTGDMNVNPKNQNAYLIPYFLSPKIGVTTNYAPIGLDTSTSDRILFVAFSDWYHGESEEYPKHEPKDDFGTLFFSGWDDQQWNLFLNFSVQCLQFYLGCKEKVGAPFGNIRKRNLISEMGPVFLEWAEDYFKSRMNEMIPKKGAWEAMKEYSRHLAGYSATVFKVRVKQFADYKGFKFNPDVEGFKKTSDGRFIQTHNGQPTEMIYLQEPQEEPEEFSLFDDNDDLYD